MRQILLALLSLIVQLTPIAATAQLSADFTCTTNDGAITITGYIGPGGAATIPSSIYDIPVTSIGSHAFYGFSSLTNVAIPDSVTSIADYAFCYCTRLSSVAIPAGVTNIGAAAFADCISLATVAIPADVSSVGPYAFDNCLGLTAITVDPQNSFYSSTNGVLFDQSQATLVECPCGMAGSYTIPNSVTKVGPWAFDGCTYLTDVTIPNGVASIGDWAFSDCWSLLAINVGPSNASYSSINGVLFNQNQTTLIRAPLGNTGSYSIPGTVTSIANYAFEGCSLSSVIIPNSVTNIGNGAFDACKRLTDITIPKSVTSMGDSPFEACLELTGITVEAGNPVYSSVNGVLFGQDLTVLIEYPNSLGGSYMIPDGVTSIAEVAFEYCAGLTNVTVPGSVINVGSYAFYGCPGLTSASFEGNAPAADSSVFGGDNQLTAVYYVPGTAGWGATFCGIPTAPSTLPYPLIVNNRPSLGVEGGQLAFTILWATNLSVVVEACTNLASPAWQPLQTNSLTGGFYRFSDAEGANGAARFYRVRTQ
jgi:hypothetical protein